MVIATGARWTRLLYSPLEIPVGDAATGPTSIRPMISRRASQLEDPVVVFDFDNYYMGSAVAEYLAQSRRTTSPT